METEIIKIRPGEGPVSEEDEEKLRAAGAILQQGGLVAFPTETVYGLGGDALNPSSSQKIYAAKGRPSDNPLIVHIYRFEDIYKITKEVPEEARKIADAFWPGPLTMILPKSDAVPYETTGGLDTVAIRMPSHPAAQKLIKYSGGYIAAPSANTSGTGWSYDNQTNTLTLDGFNYEGNGSGIETSKDLNIIIKNENRIKNISSSYSDSTNGWSCGIYAFGNLTITGDGTLDVTGGTADTSHGISVLGKLEIDSQGTIIAKAQATAGTSGIYAYDGIVIKNGNITAYAAEAAYSSRGIECDGDITISGGTVVAKAEKGEISSYGLESGKKITISPNAVVTASGVTAALNKKPEGYTGEIGTTFVSNNTNPNPTPTPEPTPAPEPTPTPSEPSTTQGESTTTSTPASTSTASTQGSQQVIPTIIEGAGSSYTQGSGNTIYFRSSDSFANFQKVMVDNAELSADCYTATEGSIIITLKPEYLSTLAAGTHSISIVSANGVATADFEVQTADTTAVSPKTGDNDQATLWITLLLLSCGALTAVGIRKKVR